MDWSKITEPLKDQILAALLQKAKDLGADVFEATPKIAQAAELGAKFLVRKISGDATADGDLKIIEGVIEGVAANTLAKVTDQQAWKDFAFQALQILVSVLPVVLAAL